VGNFDERDVFKDLGMNEMMIFNYFLKRVWNIIGLVCVTQYRDK
jgi:hypothetical protein